MITKDSDHLLSRCLHSVYRNIPVHKLIIVDGHSKDNTLKILKEFDRRYGNVEIFFDNGNRATARQKGMQEVETKWFAFVDSDIVLCNGWFKRVRRDIRSNVGAIWGLCIDIIKNLRSSLFYRLFIKVSKKSFKIRGGLHDTLIRREAIEDIKIPPVLHHYEDRFIINHIRDKGYEVLIPDNLYCLHYRPESDWNVKNSIIIATTEIKNGIIDSHAFGFMKYYPFWVCYWVLQRIARAQSKFGKDGG